jgi:hypothetical protein
MSERLADALEVQGAAYFTSIEELIHLIDNEHGILFYSTDGLMNLLNKLPQNECENYVFITMNEWTPAYGALIMHKERVDMLESMNVIIAERMSYVDELIYKFQLNKECCSQHIFPVYTPSPKFASLKLTKISGALAFLFSCLCLSFIVLVLKIIIYKARCQQTNLLDDIVQPYEFHFNVWNNLSPNARKLIHAKYMEILQLIDDDKDLY